MKNAPYFPLFISLEAKKVRFFGGGKIALRRVRTLLDFGAIIEIIAPEVNDELLEICENITKREYHKGDCIGTDLVIAATDNPLVNEEIAKECKLLNIPISVASDKDLCTFFFPAIIKNEDIVIGLTSSGKDHKKLKVTTDKIRRLFLDETDH